MFSLSRGEYATAYAELRSCFRLPQYYRLASLGHNLAVRWRTLSDVEKEINKLPCLIESTEITI